jgi:glycosyltransferase involved in cell wall biosynthesis
MSPDSVSIVIPAYNEAHRLPPTLAALAEWISGCAWPVEVWIVIEPGTDGTREIATAAAARQPNLHVIANAEQRGKGFAVRTGMLAATSEYIFYMDADLSVPLRDVDVFVEYFRTHPEVDVLLGNRQHPESRITIQQSWLRRRMGHTFNLILRQLALAGVQDTQCGFKAFRRAAAAAIFTRQQVDGFAFDVEVLLLARKLGLKIVDLPVEWRNSPESKVHMIRDSVRMLVDAFRIRRKLRG